MAAVRRLLPVWLGALFLAPVFLNASDAGAFVHVVQKGETLAGIAERVYGRIQYERILVYANALDACGGTPIVPGMRLEIPSVTHRRVKAGETWQQLAREGLGDERRAEVLAQANDAKPWIAPEDGADIVIPYNLRFVVQQRDTAPSVASRFFADKQSAWMLDRYNDINGRFLQRGDVVLVPLVDLPLTEAGKAEASAAEGGTPTEGSAAAHQAQRRVAVELPLLMNELRGGHYLESVVRANRLLALGELTSPQVAQIHRVLVEAYAAVGAVGLAGASCQKWLSIEPNTLDPVTTSPKILAACQAAEQSK